MLLVHLGVVSCHSGARGAHWGEVGVPRGAHHRGHILPRVHVHVSCVDVLTWF